MSESWKGKTKPIEFMQFWRVIANDLGNSRLKINPAASNIHDYIDPNSDAKDYFKRAIKESYQRSHCDHLRSPISITCVFDILGETAYGLRDNQRDDLFDIELLEEIAWHITNRYQQHIKITLNDKPTKKQHKAQVVSFPDYKIRIANSRL